VTGEELGRALDKLGLGLSRLLRYSYGGFLLGALAAVLNPSATKATLDAMSWQLAALSAVVLGAGIYVVHRSVVIPIHHALLCLIFFAYDKFRGIKKEDSLSPTRWFSSHKVPCGERMLAYSALRRSDFFPEPKKADINLIHAETGLVVMTSEGLAAGAVYAWLFPNKSTFGPESLVILAIIVLIASYPSDFIQHRLECRYFRNNEKQVAKVLEDQGLHFESKGANGNQ
jgi:hypothetical protein